MGRTAGVDDDIPLRRRLKASSARVVEKLERNFWELWGFSGWLRASSPGGIAPFFICH